jgi:hypothetical protein
MEEMSFKRTSAGGWIYRAPNPWLVGPGRHYLVNDEQKSKVAAHQRRTWRILFWAILATVAVGVPLAMPWADQHTLAATVGSVLVGAAVGLACNAYLARKIRPFIAGLAPTNERITQGDVFKTQIAVFSRGYLVFFAVLSLALLVLVASRPLLTAAGWDMTSLIGIVLFGFGTIYWSALYVAKRNRSVM